MVLNFAKLKKRVVKADVGISGKVDAGEDVADKTADARGCEVDASDRTGSDAGAEESRFDAHSNKASSLPRKVDKASSMPPQKVKKAKAQPAPDTLSSEDSLLLSRFCYGCPQFSVDYPFFDKEAAWCIREGAREREGESGYHMVRIYERHKISQCPLVKIGERGLTLLVEF